MQTQEASTTPEQEAMQAQEALTMQTQEKSITEQALEAIIENVEALDELIEKKDIQTLLQKDKLQKIKIIQEAAKIPEVIEAIKTALNLEETPKVIKNLIEQKDTINTDLLIQALDKKDKIDQLKNIGTTGTISTIGTNNTISTTDKIGTTENKNELFIEEDSPIENIDQILNNIGTISKQFEEEKLGLFKKEDLLDQEKTNKYNETWEESKKYNAKGALYRFAFRWTEHEKNRQDLFQNPELIIPELRQMLQRDKNDIKYIVYQTEKGKLTEKTHFQGYFALKERKRKDQLAKSLNKLMFGIEIIPVIDKDAMIAYCQKEDTRIKGPFEYPETYKGIDTQIIDKSPLKWQTKIINILKTKPDERKIIWIFDPFGKAGKSTLVKYLCFKKDAHLLSWDEQRDVYHARRMNQNKNIVLFDFSRSIPVKIDKTGLYSAIENIKNGALFSGKYLSSDVITNKPHIVCFSNILPEAKLLSDDRWEIYRILKDKDMKLMTPEECNDFIIDFWNFEEEKYKAKKEKEKNQGSKNYFKSKVYESLFPVNGNIYASYKPSTDLLEYYGE